MNPEVLVEDREITDQPGAKRATVILHDDHEGSGIEPIGVTVIGGTDMLGTQGAGVLAAPGSDFCPDSGQHFVRFSYAGATEDIEEALDRIGRWRG